MSCYRPIPATRDNEGLVTLRSTLHQARWEEGEYLELPCGRCGACRARKVRDWAVRGYHELQTSLVDGAPTGCFLTLTYDDANLPTNGGLCIDDWQNFFKRFRRRYPGRTLRYLHCGEYGERFGRPHYHAAVFGADAREGARVFPSDKGELWESPILDACWKKGIAVAAPLTMASVAYVAGYVYKKMRQAEHAAESSTFAMEHGPLHDPLASRKAIGIPGRRQEYTTVSRGRGLGTDWFNRYWADVYPSDEIFIQGKRYKPPKFYDKLLRERDPVLYDRVMAKRREYTEEQGYSTELELEARAAQFEARGRLHKGRPIE